MMSKRLLRSLFLLVFLALVYDAVFQAFGVRSRGLGVSVAAFLGFLWLHRRALALRRLASVPRGEWQDGQVVAIEGTIEVEAPVITPFGGIESAAYLYAIIEDHAGTELNGRYVHFCGGAMARSVVRGRGIELGLVGVPALHWFPKERWTDDPAFERASLFVANERFVALPHRALRGGMFGNEIIFERSSDFSIHVEIEPGGSELRRTATGDAARAREALSMPRCSLEERIVRTGERITAVGVYRKTQEALELGSFLPCDDQTSGLYRGSLLLAARRMTHLAAVAVLLSFWLSAYLHLVAFSSRY